MSEGAGASRRRHTRWPRDWSSDVCSSDLPLLVSVRSGAVYSMPGMMDTVLNLGLNDETVKGIAKLTNNSRFAYDCYRRFIQMFSDVVLGVRSEERRVGKECRCRRGLEQAEDGIRDGHVTGVQTCALPIFLCLSPSVLVLFIPCLE